MSPIGVGRKRTGSERASQGSSIGTCEQLEIDADVPDVSLVVIEHADRFGTAQRHQLGGRVERGAAALGMGG